MLKVWKTLQDLHCRHLNLNSNNIPFPGDFIMFNYVSQSVFLSDFQDILAKQIPKIQFPYVSYNSQSKSLQEIFLW